MKAITIWQPWAWAIFHGKDIENRDWRTRYNGRLLIHAGKRWDGWGFTWIRNNFPALSIAMPHRDEYPYGCLLGTVDLVDCVDRHSSPWFVGPWGHVYKYPVEFKRPIPWRGHQLIFDVPDDVIDSALSVGSSDRRGAGVRISS